METFSSQRQLLSSLSYDTSVTTDEFLTNVAISVPIGVVLILLYCLLRMFMPETYEVRRKFAQVIALDDQEDVDLSKERKGAHPNRNSFIGHPEISTGFIRWVYEVWTMDTATYFKYGGLDALIFRIYLKGCVYICLAALPYALFVLLPVYATGLVQSSDILKMFTVNNCDTSSSRLWATVIGEYVFILIAIYYLSKVYLAIAFAADQNSVGNAGASKSLKQLDKMSWFSVKELMTTVIEFNVNVVSTGISKIQGAIGLASSNDENDNSNNNDAIGNSGMSSMTSTTNDGNGKEESSALVKGSSYGATDDVKEIAQTRETSEEILVGVNPVPIDKYTVMIRDLPTKFQNDKTFEKFMNRMFPNRIQKIYMLRDVRHLTLVYNEIQKHEKSLNRLRRKYGSSMVDSDNAEITETGCCKNDSKNIVKHHKDELIALKRQFMITRDDLDTSPTAFVTFKDLQSASICCTCPIRFGLYPLKIHQAPNPLDIKWQNLKYNSLQLAPNNFMALILFGLLLIFWSIPVASIQALANLKTIFSYANIDLSKYLSDTTIDWLEGWLSVLVLDLFLQILPLICAIITNLQRKPSRGKEEILILTKYYDCLVVMVLLITVLAGTIFSSLDSFEQSMNKIFETLASGLASISTYFLLYIFLNAFIWLPLELFRPGYFIKSKLGLKDANKFQYAKWYGKTMLILVICITYSSMCPLVWILGLVYFTFCTIVFSYQLSMAYIPEYEVGARVWPAVFTRLCTTFNIGVATMVGLLFLKKFYVGAALVFPLFLYNVLSNALKLQFRKVFRASSLTSAVEKDNVLKSHNSNIEMTWNDKYEMAYFPPIMDIDYSNDDPNGVQGRNPISVEIEQSGAVQAPSTYQSDSIA